MFKPKTVSGFKPVTDGDLNFAVSNYDDAARKDRLCKEVFDEQLLGLVCEDRLHPWVNCRTGNKVRSRTYANATIAPRLTPCRHLAVRRMDKLASRDTSWRTRTPNRHAQLLVTQQSIDANETV